jgi:outer membrane protein insertion porin family
MVLLIYFLLNFCSTLSYAIENPIPAPYRLIVDCGDGELCNGFKKRLSYLDLQRRNKIDITKYIGHLFSEGGVSLPKVTFSNKENEEIHVSFKIKPRIKDVELSITDGEIDSDLSSNLLQTGEVFTMYRERENLQNLKKSLLELGYDNAEIKLDKTIHGEAIELTYQIKLNQPIVLDSVEIETSNVWVKKQLENFVSQFVKKTFSRSTIYTRIDEYIRQLKSYGFHLLNHEILEEPINSRLKKIKVRIQPGRMYSFAQVGQSMDEALRSYLIDKLFKFNSEPGVEDVKENILKYFSQFGYRQVSLDVMRYEYMDHDKISHLHFQFNLKKGIRTKISRVIFKGNNFFSQQQIQDLFYTNGTDLVGAKNYDESYVTSFSELLTKKFQEFGYVSAVVLPPKLFFSNDQRSVEVNYTIKEGPRTFVESLKFYGLSQDALQINSIDYSNKVGQYFNPATLKSDLEKILDELNKLGYYQAKVDTRPESLVKYSTDLSSVQLHFKVELGAKYTIDKVIIAGAEKSKLKLIRRNLRFKEGQLLVAKKLSTSRVGLNNTGLFNKVRIEPIFYGASSQVDVVVFLEEKKFGTVEVAPGFRTDIGAKLSTSVTYSNLFGLNHSITIRGQVNQRLNFSTLDDRRREEQKEFLEYEGRVTYNAPSIFDSQFDYSVSTSFQKRRFYSFDADIQRLANNIKRSFGANWSATLRHQVERIEQFDASNLVDNGQFTIGSITPGISYDARNNQVNPTKGYWGSLSAEYASPGFLSEESVNYVKWIGRNRFYFPIPNGVIASSLTLGLQKNLGKDDEFIPNIKVFRLSGADIVRGFDDQEINRISNGQEISDILVNDAAYMTNIKIEPRFFINDTMMWGVFYDAGRIYVNSWTSGDLRSSVGLTFKYVTPVGTLDFDYGVKLLRKETSDGNLESPGRLHISIGFF